MSRSQRPRKAYRPKFEGDNVKLRHQLWKVHAVFSPLESIIDQLEQHGTIDETPSGQAVFKNHEGDWFDTAAAVIGVVEAYEIHEIRTGRPLNLAPLRQLANKLQYRMPIFESETKAVRECLARMKAETLEMTAGYARDLIKDFQIKEALQREAA